MKKVFKGLICILLIASMSITAYAGAEPSKLNKTGKDRAKELYQYLISSGYTPESACGVLGNADQESSFNTGIDANGRKGTFQFTSEVASAIKKWADKNKLDPNSSMVQYQWLEKNSLKRDFKVYSDITLAKFKKLKDAEEAADAFCAAYERCVTSNPGGANANNCKHAKNSSQYYQDLKTRRTYAKQFLEEYANIKPVNSNGTNKLSSTKDSNGNDTSNIVVQNGTYGIIDPASGTFQSLDDSITEFMREEDLSKDQLKSIADWKNNIDYENDDGVLKFIRVVVMLLGILFLVWVLIIYLCYWMDRINNFIDIDFLPIATGGRLRVSPEEHECSFNPKNFTKGQPQTVNHRAILGICLIGIFFAVLVITGKLYDVINFIVRKILGWLGLV